MRIQHVHFAALLGAAVGACGQYGVASQGGTGPGGLGGHGGTGGGAGGATGGTAAGGDGGTAAGGAGGGIPIECGNDLAQVGEACDGSDLNGRDCASEVPGSPGGVLMCTEDCGGFDLSLCNPAPTCGDGDLDSGEACEGDDLDGETCESLGYAGGALACHTNCTLDASGCNACGNGVIDNGEQCDGLALGAQSCEGLGKPSGALACNADCTFRTLGCGASWAQWPMPNPPNTGLPNPTSFTIDAANDTVVDDVTGLMWQRTFFPGLMSWSDAIAACEALEHGGFADWRLPTRIELVTLTNFTIPEPGPSIDLNAFPGTPNTFFWTITPFVGIPDSVWGIDFYWGSSYYLSNATTAYVRCVR